jgi:hypothetical protein
MNIANAPIVKLDTARCENLLDCIRSMRVSVGDEITDEEFTRLFRHTEPAVEAGFSFLSYCNRFALFSVPQQDFADWYPEHGWISPEKEKIARTIAEKYEFTVCEPPDLKDPCKDAPNPHHHLQMSDRQETMVVIHPQFLKVRLFALAGRAQKPLHRKCELLQNLSALYAS